MAMFVPSIQFEQFTSTTLKALATILIVASEANIKWTMEGDGTADEGCMDDTYIYAIPLSEHDFAYTATTTKTFINSTSYQDVLTFSPTASSTGDHLIMATSFYANEVGASERAFFSLDIGAGATSTDDFQILGQFDEDSDDGWSLIRAFKTHLTKDVAYTVAIKGKSTSSNSNREASYQHIRMLVLDPREKPAPAPSTDDPATKGNVIFFMGGFTYLISKKLRFKGRNL